MAENKYPIGIQSFQKIIEGGFTYVDKTHYIAKLITEGQYIFLSRPRRFGKSLLLSTLHAYFDGRRDLFKGLAIDTMDMDWTPRPVLHFDFNSENYTDENALSSILNRLLGEYEQIYGQKDIADTLAGRFSQLIKRAAETAGHKVVILVDEYDKPLLGLDENTDLYEKRQGMLKGFYSNLKSMDGYIEFAMLTGVARFSKVSIFSDLNNLKDISMFERYQEICGWTEDELTSYFQSGIGKLSRKRHEAVKETIDELRSYYDGYLFSESGRRLYNPFSILMALDSESIKPYWFETGTPTFLVKKIKKSGIDPGAISGQTQSYSDLVVVGDDNIIALMFQTGYLTIATYDMHRHLYTLRFPNREVEIGFANNLLPLYAPATKTIGSPFNLERFRDDLYDGEPESFMKRLESLFKDLPGEDHRESAYRAVTYLLCLLSGTEASAERHSYKGRSDLETLTPGYVYVFEFKYNKSVAEAMEQLHSRDYAGRYAPDARKVYLIGANYDEHKDTRSLAYEIEELKR